MTTRSKPTAAAYAASHMSVAILALLSSAGFSRSSSSAAALLSEITQRYIQLIGSACVQHANHAGRNVISPHDLRASLEHILGGDPLEELLDWAEQEGKLHDSEQSAALQTNGINGLHAEETTSTLPQALQDPMRGKDLIRVLNAGRILPSLSDMEEIHFQAISSEDFEQAAAESIIREHMVKRLVWPGPEQQDADTPSLMANGEASTQGSSSSGDRESALFSDIEDGDESDVSEIYHSSNTPSSPHLSIYPQKRRKVETDNYISRRRFGQAVIDYVPAYLPMFPGAPLSLGATEATTTMVLPDSEQFDLIGSDMQEDVVVKAQPVEVDPEYVLEEKKRKELAQKKADEAAAAAAAAAAEAAKSEEANGDESQAAPVLQKTAEERAAEAEKAFEALQARRVLRDSWRESVTYDASTLAATYTKDELQNLEQNATFIHNDVSIASIAPATSSLRAFAAEYQVLVEDPTSSSAAGIYLTPSGPAHQDAATKRRRLAHALADASRYTPNDSLYAAVAARPSVIPFNPGPSWLVSTLPPPTLYEDNVEVANALSAPVLTPVRPQGRPAALIPPSGSLVPTLGHRHPSHLTIGARVVASADLLQRVSRFDDPIPILDDKHAERFFHGLPASRDLLGGSGSSSDLSSNISSTRSSGGGGSGSGNSTLRPALEKLVLQMREKEAEILPEEDKEELQRRQQELQLQLQAALASENSGGGKDSAVLSSGLIADSYASRIRNGNITMVHTWDWTPRDPYDAMLPGKKVKTPGSRGVGPVALEKRMRSESTNSDLADAGTNGTSV
ncbi:uncharacterized protein UMAG_02400 [Mycosarcoma maydis]|uniref:Bromodomain associated domain-containing protein n=1 Tax=Mycosarcoma maydis TaxID=5270 RepID=A0A0D1E115_MYCMD|nr:uncharacterized protein UMAG_02400 [Ustilago maydis 521]KIS69884.1 hypothetical protein UMAG_02400 [Ustilago maydis 521]|eukprot:XP_011388695.1 hypothetical protein UMAG_02400 [Ustilago maydis 521]